MKLRGKKIAILVEEGYDDFEFWYPKIRLEEESAEVFVVAPKKGEYKSKHGIVAKVDLTAEEANPEEFDALVIPGGHAPDRLRRYESVLEFVRKMDELGKTIAIICHAGHVLVSAKILKGRKVTGFFSIKDDLVNAGAEYLDEPVVVDGNLISSRHPGDLGHFMRAIIERLAGE